MKPMLAKVYGKQNIDNWLMSEKLDGVRALWNGTDLMSRNGNVFAAPGWFTDQLPQGIALDGELYLGRGQFQKTISIVRKMDAVDAEWQQIKFCVFDAPEVAGGFEARLSFCIEALRGCAVALVVAHRVCRDRADLAEYFTELSAVGAEGVMLRAPGSQYEQKRSANLLKYKSSQSDEAVVIGSQPGMGQFAGMTGALILKWRNKTFEVGTGLSNQQRANPPQRGSLVSFGYCGLTDGGKPRFPKFLAERNYE